jgi:DNA-binding NtrC family response regulator
VQPSIFRWHKPPDRDETRDLVARRTAAGVEWREVNATRLPARVLIVEDEADQRSDLAEMVTALGYEVCTAGDGQEALRRLASFPANVILSDLVMPGGDGTDLLKELQARGDRTPTIVLTGFGSIEQAISIVHDLKAFWFVEKPVQPGVLKALLERAHQQDQLLIEADLLNRQLSYQGVLCDLVGDSGRMREIFSLIRQIAPTTASVLITGESGTGKELVARAIHRLSPRSGGPFIAVNCAALPESLMESELFGHEKGAFTGAVERRAGCFERAQNGTLLLDEIGEMPIGTQAKLLRVIEESKVRRLGGSTDIPIAVRVLAATNHSPEKAIQSKLLREDLYYRLNVFHLSLPSLRERREDIPLIGAALIRDLNKKHGCRATNLSADVLRRFEEYSWPGNVRELRNVVERAVILAGEGEVQLRHLPVALAPTREEPVPQPSGLLQVPVGARMKEVEEAYIRLVLQHTSHNRKRAAEILDIGLHTLYNKLRAYREEEERAAGRGA